MAAALVLPLVLYRVAATVSGEQLRPATDFAIFAAVSPTQRGGDNSMRESSLLTTYWSEST